jgi:hypothetical protein
VPAWRRGASFRARSAPAFDITLMLVGLRWKGSEARQHRAERKEAKSAGRAGTRSRKKPEARRYLDGDADAHSSGATASN